MRFSLQILPRWLGLALIVSVCLVGLCYAAETAPAGEGGAPLTSPTAISAVSRIIPVGVSGPATTRTVAGAAIIGGLVPQTVRPASVNFYADGALLGSTNKRPFRCDWDTTKVSDGEHTVKVSALSADGKEIWSGEAKVIIANKGGGTSTPKNSGKPPAPTASLKPTTPSPPTPAPSPIPKVEVLKSERYGFQVSYPAGWTMTNQTAKMEPKWPGGFWFVFSRGPVKKADVAINLRHKTEPAPTTAEAFAQRPENAFVNDWKRVKVNGKDAFRTTQGSPKSKRVIHRCMIVDGAHVWMLNCIDTSGGPADQSKAFFDIVVNSLALLTAGKPEPPKAQAAPKPAPPPMPTPAEVPSPEEIEELPAPEAGETAE